MVYVYQTNMLFNYYGILSCMDLLANIIEKYTVSLVFIKCDVSNASVITTSGFSITNTEPTKSYEWMIR